MANIADNIDVHPEWVQLEISDDEIPTLKKKLMEGLLKDGRIDLLPFYGYLQTKEKIWTGKLIKMKPNNNERQLFSNGYQDLYLVEVCVKILDQMKKFVPNDDKVMAAKQLSVFGSCLSRKSNVHDKNKASWQAICDYIATYREEIDKFACFNQHLVVDSIQATLNSLKTKLQVFVAILHDHESPNFLSTQSSVEGYDIREMTLDETLYATDHWKFKNEKSKFRFSCSSSVGLAIGAFPHGSEFPVSWAFMSWEGAIAALQTLPGYRGRGLAKAVIKRISSNMVARGFIPFVFIEDIDTSFVPESLFTSLGFIVHKDTKFAFRF